MFAPAASSGSAFVPSSRLGRERLRTYRVLAAARVLMSLMLLGWLVLLPMMQAPPHAEKPAIATLGYGVALLYVALTAASLWWSFVRTQGLAWQVLIAIAVDLLAFTTLQFTAGYPAREFSLIYALPVLAAGIYGTLSLTLFVAALVTMILLGSAGFAMLGGAAEAEQRMLNAAFVGIAYFAVAVLTWQLSQRLARQEARAAASEMHSGFQSLRGECPMALDLEPRVTAISEATQKNVRRIVTLWSQLLRRSGGPFLAGEWSIADAFYTPVATRFRGYGIHLSDYGDDGACGAYVTRLLATPEFLEWEAAAKAGA